MSGIGEVVKELRETMADMLKNSYDILTIGQYLQPSQFHLPVERFVPPDELRSLRAKVFETFFSKGLAASPSSEVPSKSAASMMRLSNPSESVSTKRRVKKRGKEKSFKIREGMVADYYT